MFLLGRLFEFRIRLEQFIARFYYRGCAQLMRRTKLMRCVCVPGARVAPSVHSSPTCSVEIGSVVGVVVNVWYRARLDVEKHDVHQN